jgi:acetolactate synthase-1/3 small subunit
MKHIISALVENRAGVLARVANLFSSRGYNIDSLSVAETDNPTVSRMTIVVRGEDEILEQITKQLNKLIDVIKVEDFVKKEYLERELLMIKVNTRGKSRSEIIAIADIFQARIIDVGAQSLIIEVTGDEKKNFSLIELLKPFGIIELIRTGKIAILKESSRKKGGT